MSLKVEITRLQGELKASNQLLDQRSNGLAIERSLRSKLEATTNKPPAKNHTLVIWSSIIPNLDENLYLNTKVESNSEATPNDITDSLKQHNMDSHKYSKAIVVTGGNQLNFDDGEHIENCIEETPQTKRCGDHWSIQCTCLVVSWNAMFYQPETLSTSQMTDAWNRTKYTYIYARALSLWSVLG